MLKSPVPMFHPDLSVRLKGIAEKQVPTKLKPMLGVLVIAFAMHHSHVAYCSQLVGFRSLPYVCCVIIGSAVCDLW